MPLMTRAVATLAATAVVLAPTALALSPAHADGPTRPSLDDFYQYGVAPSATVDPGTVLDDRTATLPGIPGSAEQLLYRTTDEQGQPSATVTTVIKPAGPSRGIVAYLSFYDGLGDVCDPSYTLQGGNGGNGQEALVIRLLVSSGYTVTVPDFEGETHDWAAGHEAGWSTLDAIRATEQKLDLPATTPVGLMGYSGGSIAGDWASELAASYAPGLNLVGTAIGGVPVNLADVMNYVDGSDDPDGDGNIDPVDAASDDWAGVIPAAMVSLARANGEDFSAYESTDPTYTTPDGEDLSGQDIADRVKDQCINDFKSSYPGLHVSDLLAPGYDSLLDIPGVGDGPSVHEIVSRNLMGTGGTPTMPMLIVQGNNDGSGDGVMFAADVKRLADTYSAAGVSVNYQPLLGQDHTTAGQSFVASALTFLGNVLPVPPADDGNGNGNGNGGGNGNGQQPVPGGPTTQQPQPAVVKVKLKGHSKGGKDILVVKAKGVAAHTKVKLFRAGHKKAIDHAKLGKHGKVTLKVKDRNGSRKTRYHAVVAATSTTQRTTTTVLRLR